MFWVQHAHKAAPVKNVAATAAPQAPPAAKTATPKFSTTKDGDLAPGIDGGAADNDLPYVFRRQPTFYRTLQPVGTIIIDKLQHYLYLIQPNNVALRYGIGLGEQCTELAGLRHVASKAEWPPWQATPDMIARKLAKPGVLAGGPGNPLGARVMELDDGTSRINGTNAPATIGTNVIFGCVRLGNDDVVDLYGRVQNGTAVVVTVIVIARSAATKQSRRRRSAGLLRFARNDDSDQFPLLAVRTKAASSLLKRGASS